jgi:1-phosphofructokinase family hexose kinase
MSSIYTLTLNPAVDRELTVPAIEYDTVLRASQWQVDYGGKGFNVSRMLKSMGTDNVALGFAGGKSGEVLQEGLESLGIGTDFVWVGEETRTNVSIVTDAHDRYIKVNEPGPTISPAELEALIEKVRQSSAPGDWWVLAGSLPPGVPASVYAELITVIQQAGAHAILDTSGEALRLGCKAKPFIVKPNEVEAHQLTGLPVASQADIANAAQAIQALGPTYVIISLGKQGVMAVTPEQTWLVASPKVEERNPIGAGDSLVGGLTWGLYQGNPIEEALRWGVACGAAAASLSGTGVASFERVQSLHARTTAQQL